MADTLSDDQLVDVLQRYLTILQGHARTRLEFFLRSWKAPSPVSEEYAGKCIHRWRVREVEGAWRVAAQMVERFEDLNDNSKMLFATPMRA
jgi:hypothetical protein